MKRLFIFCIWLIVTLQLHMGDSLAQITTTWTGGGSSSNWDDPQNWNNGAPGPSDNAVINSTGGFNPVLNLSASVNDLTINSEGKLTVNGQQLTVTGNLTVTISNTAGDGLIMTDPADELIVEGNAVFTTVVNEGSAHSTGHFTDGVLRLRGDFTQIQNGSSGSQTSFVSTGTKAILDGTGTQTIHFVSPGATVSRFHNVDITNAAGVTFTSNVYVTGQLTLFSGAVLNQNGTVSSFYTTRLPVLAGDATYNVVNTQVQGDIVMTTPVVLPQPDNHLLINVDTNLRMNGQRLTVGGNLTVTISNTAGDGLIMTDPADDLIVEGNAVFTTSVNHGSAHSTGHFTDGVLRLRGDFTQVQNGSSGSQTSFVSTGTKVILDGTDTQTIHFVSPGATVSRFHDVDIANAAGITFISSAAATGTVTILDGTVTSTTGTVTIGEDLVDAAGNRWQALNTNFSGGDVSLPATLTTSATFSGGGVLTNGFTLTGNLSVATDGHLVVNGQTVLASGNLTVTISNTAGDGLIMTDPADDLIVEGDAVFTTSVNHGSAHSTGHFTDGVLRLRGDFTQVQNGTSGSQTSFVSTGTKVILDGTGAQTVSFANPGAATSRFHNVDITNAAGVTFTSSVYVTDQLTLVPGSVLNQSGSLSSFYTTHLPVLAEDATYNVVNTQVQGDIVMTTPVVLPQPDNHLIINAEKSLVVNGQQLRVGGNLTVTISNTTADGLIMTDPADELIIDGDAVFTTVVNHGLANSTGNFTAGVLRLRGDYTQIQSGGVGSQTSFVSTGTKVIFDGTGTQTVSFANPGTTVSRFHDVGIENTSLSSVIFISPVVATGQLISPSNTTSKIVGNGHAFSVTGLDVDRLILDNVAFTVNGGPIDRFDHVTFQNYASTTTQFTLNHTDLNAAFAGLVFLVEPTSGKYLVANDTDGGIPATVTLVNAQPTDGSAFTGASGGFIVNWTTQLYAVDDFDNTLEDIPVIINVLDNDMNPDEGILTITGVTQGAGGTVTIDPGDTTITYTPIFDFHGADTFTYTMSDGTDTDTAGVMVTVVPDEEPVITAHPSPMDFGPVTVGGHAEQTLYVRNEGPGHLIVTDINDPFFVVTDTNFTVAPGDSHAVIVTFLPEIIGPVSDTLRILSNDGQTPELPVLVSGFGLPAGDVNGDEDVNIIDVIALIRIILGQDPAPGPEIPLFQRADVNGDGNLNVLDLVALINIILDTPQGKPTSTVSTARIDLGALQVLDSQGQVVPLQLQFAGAVAGLQLTFTYDPAILRVGTPEPTGRLDGMRIESHDTEGTLRMLVYSPNGRRIAPGDGVLFHLPVTLQGDTDDGGLLFVTEAIVAMSHGQPAPVILPGQLRVASLPAVFALRLNRPNPFNPSTVIAYEAPRQTHVRIVIYNLLGQEVIRLVDESKSPGRYHAIWHGTNAQGQAVASGVYLYRMTTGTGFTQTRRMTLLK